MKKPVNIKKLLLPNLPYVFIGLFATNLGEAFRLMPGADLSEKLLHITVGFSAAFESLMPSFHPFDLLVGIASGGLLRLIVCIVVTLPAGIAFGWLDLVWVLLFKKLFLQ